MIRSIVVCLLMFVVRCCSLLLLFYCSDDYARPPRVLFTLGETGEINSGY